MKIKFLSLILPLLALNLNINAQGKDSNLKTSFAEKKYELCLESCNEILQSDSTDQSANYYKGAVLVKYKKYKTAERHFKKAEENGYQPKITLQVNLLRSYAGQKKSTTVISLLQNLADGGFQAFTVLDESEFHYLKNNSTFAKLKIQVDKNAYPCKYGAEYQRLDFWLGEWDVYVNDVKTASSVISKSEGGCTLHENYKTVNGFLGRSMNYFDPEDKLYTQIWVDKSNSILIFKEVESRPNYLQMESKKNDIPTTKMIYIKDSKTGNITQTMESSNDGGKTWKTSFVGVYKKKQH